MRFPKSILALACSFAATGAFAADKDDPELAYNGHCRECHSFAEADNRLGPTLYDVIGRKAGTVKGFAYSEAVKNSGITWDEKTLDKWIANPNAVVPGNNMGSVFPGLPDEKMRAKIIAFLKSKSAGGDNK